MNTPQPSRAWTERKEDRANSLQSQSSALFGQETWGADQLELKQQTKSLASFRAASLTVPGQGMYITASLTAKYSPQPVQPANLTQAQKKLHTPRNSPTYSST